MKVDNLINVIKMDSDNKKSIIAWFLVMIFIGAIGSGLWESLLRPILLIIGRLMFNLLTFGIDVLKNSLYIEIAAGFHEQIALMEFSMLGGIVIGLLIIFTCLTIYSYDNINIKNIILLTESRMLRYLQCYIYVMMILTIGGRVSIEIYKNMAITHFEQCCIICSPYITDNDLKIIKSSFARIKNRDDYINVIGRFKGIADTNNIELPDFKPW